MQKETKPGKKTKEVRYLMDANIYRHNKFRKKRMEVRSFLSSLLARRELISCVIEEREESQRKTLI